MELETKPEKNDSYSFLTNKKLMKKIKARDGFRFQNVKCYVIDDETKESKLSIKKVMVQNSQLSVYASTFRVLSDEEVRLAQQGFLDVEDVRKEAIKRLSHPNDRDIENGYEPILRPDKHAILAKCEEVKRERIHAALAEKAKHELSVPLQQEKRK